MATTTAGDPAAGFIPTNKIFLAPNVDVSVGCVVRGGFTNDLEAQVEVIAVNYIVGAGGATYLEVTLNQVAFTGTAPSGVVNNGFNTSSQLSNLTLGYTSVLEFICTTSTDTIVDAYYPSELYGAKTLSFKDSVKGWVSFKSFFPEQALSMANDYYTLFAGDLYIHHIENVDRNTFYDYKLDFPFTPSTVDVMLNDNPSFIKEFNTLNYEGSQSKVNKFTYKELLEIPEQPDTSYSDQEYYNLEEKLGWNVASIITNDEDGYIDEFIEKEGKWFNNIKRKVDLSLEKADTSDFSFQGIGLSNSITVIALKKDESSTDRPCYQCDDTIVVSSLSNFILGAEGDYSCPEGWQKEIPICGTQVVYGCTDPRAVNYDPLATIDDGSCTRVSDSEGESDSEKDSEDEAKQFITGCTDSESTNYNPKATIDDGSCYYLGDNPCKTISGTEGCDDWNNYLKGIGDFDSKISVATYWAGYFNSQPEQYSITPIQLLEQFEKCCS